ncbi:M24 family metallopeptidase, partial [Listeria monocytogenes]|nr:M24 family metallopeptidase [Listeria monocytogenes]
HGTGHGIGLSCHEYPSINQQAEICLQPNMFFTVEPGIYLPNKGGVRIEDDVRVLADGTVASLTKSNTEWVEL